MSEAWEPCEVGMHSHAGAWERVTGDKPASIGNIFLMDNHRGLPYAGTGPCACPEMTDHYAVYVF